MTKICLGAKEVGLSHFLWQNTQYVKNGVKTDTSPMNMFF